MPALNAIIEGIVRRLNAHKSRHEADGADEIDVTELSGVPSVVSNIVSYEDNIVFHEDNIVERE